MRLILVDDSTDERRQACERFIADHAMIQWRRVERIADGPGAQYWRDGLMQELAAMVQPTSVGKRIAAGMHIDEIFPMIDN